MCLFLHHTLKLLRAKAQTRSNFIYDFLVERIRLSDNLQRLLPCNMPATDLCRQLRLPFVYIKLHW